MNMLLMSSQTSIPFLGSFPSQNKLGVDPERTRAIREYPIPKNVRLVSDFRNGYLLLKIYTKSFFYYSTGKFFEA